MQSSGHNTMCPPGYNYNGFVYLGTLDTSELMHLCTSCAQVHELLQSHCGDNREGTLFSWLHIYHSHLASVRLEHSAYRVTYDHLCIYIWSWVQVPLRPTFYSYFKESFSGEYHMYQLIPLHSCDYLNKISIKINVVTDEGNSQNEMWHWTNDEVGAAIQNWLRVRVELMAC